MHSSTTPSTPLQQLFEDEWEFRLRENPLFATYVGDHRYNDRLPHVTEDDFARRLAQMRTFRRRLEAIDRSTLTSEEQLNYDIFRRSLEDETGELEFRAYLMPIAKAGGFHTEFADLPVMAPFYNLGDYENYLARLEAFPSYVAEYIDLMRAGIRSGYVPARDVMEGVDDSLRAQLVDVPEKSIFFQPFERFPQTISTANQQRLRQAGMAAIQNAILLGHRQLLQFIHEEYLFAARQEIAASALPDGPAFYDHRIRYFTSLRLTPQEVHATGLAEVQRIHAEMQALIDKVAFQGSFQDFIGFLRTDPRFYVDTPEALLKEVAFVLKKMDGELPRLFKTLPRMPYGIRPIPEFSAPGNTTAYYFPPSGDGSRAGIYYVNTYDLKSRPLYEIEALSLHEAVPGHHLQIALQQELEGLPNFRRFGGFVAFVEGWALYAERLGLEVGFYQDPFSDFGRLTYEMWRACRLVVDTGMHALGWSRQQAIDFMTENTASTLLNIVNEVDRYIAWPGQALAYKIGELKIRELRAQAEQALGQEFNLRQFHSLILSGGALPLDILEGRVYSWLKS